MRYMRIKWLGGKPSDRDVFVHLSRILGRLAVAESKLRVDGTITCENEWVDRVRGALALKWQFTARVSGTKKALGKTRKG
jgi:hypothetical protein